MQRLIDKTCVITGAARGIGRAIAARFHHEGGVVIITDVDADAGEATAAEIGCQFQRVDVREEVDWLQLTERIPTVDVVVNNAGVTGFEKGMVGYSEVIRDQKGTVGEPHLGDIEEPG